MKETAIIYCRKSTDREEMQQNSLEHQLNNCRNTVKIRDFVLLDEIVESVSAKEEYKRAWFNRMIDECKKWKIDYIIIDEPKRLSRNNIDSSRAIDLLDKYKIKGVVCTWWRQFLAESSTDKLMLLFELWFSKKDNEDRSKDVKDKMRTALHKWKWLWQAIFWYKNVWSKWKKDIAVIEDEAKLVREAFIMRSQNMPLQKIADYINEQTWTKWNAERVSKMLKNTKYYWLQQFWGQEALLDSPWYRPIISKELFDKVNSIFKAVDYQKRDDIPRYFTNILKDTEWYNLYPYEQKWHIYYHQGSRTGYKINISQKYIFTEFEKYIENYNFPKPFILLFKATLKDYYKDKLNNRENDLRKATKELNLSKERLSSLLNKFLDNNIDKETYDFQKEKLELQKSELEEKIKAINQWDDNVVKIIENLCELVENLSTSYKTWNNEKKWKIIRAMQCELIINNKKELVIKENKLFETIRLFNFQHWYSQGELNPCLDRERVPS